VLDSVENLFLRYWGVHGAKIMLPEAQGCKIENMVFPPKPLAVLSRIPRIAGPFPCDQ
jgi:hypothetical protein